MCMLGYSFNISDFINNIIDFYALDIKYINEEYGDEVMDLENFYDIKENFWNLVFATNILSDILGYDLSYIIIDYSDTIYIGMSPKYMRDDETLEGFKDRIHDMLCILVKNEDLGNIEWIENPI